MDRWEQLVDRIEAIDPRFAACLYRASMQNMVERVDGDGEDTIELTVALQPHSFAFLHLGEALTDDARMGALADGLGVELLVTVEAFR